MNELLFKHIQQKTKITVQEFEAIERLTKVLRVDKNQHFINTGETVPYLAFVNIGALYAYTIDEKGERHVLQIALSGHWISDPYGFLSGNKAIHNVCALENTQLTLISKDKFEEACDTNQKFERYFRILIQNAYIQSLQRISGIYSHTAEERYRALMVTSPEVMQKVPQHYIASFLGIKPQSLSRIRKAMSQKGK